MPCPSGPPYEHVMSVVLFSMWLAVLVALVGAWVDVRTGHIPNWLTMGAAACAPLLYGAEAFSSGSSIEGALYAAAWSLSGALACICLPMFMFTRGALGGGDVKLFAAVGALCHPALGLRAQLYSFAVGGLYALALAASRGRLQAILGNAMRVVLRSMRSSSAHPLPLQEMTPVRFGPAIFLGTAASVWLRARAA